MGHAAIIEEREVGENSELTAISRNKAQQDLIDADLTEAWGKPKR